MGKDISTTNQLCKHIILTCGSIENFAKDMNMTPQGVYKKVKNLKSWTVADIEKARKVLHINNEAEFIRIFFE